MNCPCCSAPLPGGDLRRDGPVCAYCGSRLDLDLEGWSHLRPLGLSPTLHCPDCRRELERLQLGGSEPLELNRCPDCLGLFLPLGALERLVAQEGRSALQIDHRLLQALSDTPRGAQAPPRYRPCPSCGDLMNRSLQGRRSGVVVDRCRDHGLWLDAGELRQLLEWARAGGLLLDLERRREEAEQELRRLRAERAAPSSALPSAPPSAVDALAWQQPSDGQALLNLLVRLARQLP